MKRRIWCVITALAAGALGVCAAEPASADSASLKSQKVKLKDNRSTPSRVDFEIEMVQIPAGKITLKDDKGKPVEHTIKPIWIGKYEHQWPEYDIFWQVGDIARDRDRWKEIDAQSRPSKPYMNPHDGGTIGYPAEGVHIKSVKLYCEWLSRETGMKFRLPTAAEWEYACRAGGPELKPDKKTLGDIAWYSLNADDHAQSVGKKRPNAWGLYDMLGNVAEFVIDDVDDPQGIAAGGSWSDEAEDVHSGARERYKHAWQKRDPQEPHSKWWLDSAHHVGFRLVMEEFTPEEKAAIEKAKEGEAGKKKE